MAKSIQNVVMQGASGKIGKTLVFRQMPNGETVIANKAKRRTKPLTANQEAVVDKFQQATYMARILASDPVLGPAYKAKAGPGQSAYILAMKDCLTPPTIKSIDTLGYTGAVNQGIVIRATDDFKVESVRVRILKPDDTVLEQGIATIQYNNLDWVYVSTLVNGSLLGTKIEVTAIDIPGNETVETVTIS